MQPRPASYANHSKTAPDVVEPGVRAWITRGTNMVVAVSDVTAGAVLPRSDQGDEYMVFVARGTATISAGSGTIAADAETLTIVPPGESRVTATSDARIVRVFSTKAADLAALAQNAATYAEGAPEVAPIVPWPTRRTGFACASAGRWPSTSQRPTCGTSVRPT
jgi:hypothetical protein